MSTTGIVIVVYATSIGADIDVERSGSANSWDVLTTVVDPPMTGYPISDLHPIDGKVYWFRCRHSELGYNDSAYTPIVSGTACIIPDPVSGWQTNVVVIPTDLSVTNLVVSNSGSITYLTSSYSKLGAVTYNGLQTGSFIVHPSSFVGTTSTTNYTISGDGSYIHLGSGEVVVAPIHLPYYAKTAHLFSVISNTNTSASTTTVELMHTNGWDTSSVVSPGQAALINVTGAGGMKLTTDAINFTLMTDHQVWVQITGGHGSHYIYGAKFDYIY